MASRSLPTTDQTMSIGRIISRTFAVIGGNPTTVVGISFVIGALPAVALGYVEQHARAVIVDQIGVGGMLAIFLAAALFDLMLGALVQGAIVRATVAHGEGRRASIGESVTTGLAVALPLLALAILMALGIGLGLILLIVPGITLYIIWSVAAPALVVERTSVFGAFARSAALTSGARWKIFGLELIVLVIYWVISAVIAAAVLALYGFQEAAAFSQGSWPIGWIITQLVLKGLLLTFSNAIQTSLYVELRDWKEGPSASNLEDIFA